MLIQLACNNADGLKCKKTMHREQIKIKMTKLYS